MGGALEQFGQCGRHRHFAADQWFDHRLELGRMRGSRHGPVPRHAFGAQLLQQRHRRGGMRAEHVPGLCRPPRDQRADGCIVHRLGTELRPQCGIVVGIQPTQPFEIAWGAHVHGVGQGGHAGRRLVGGPMEEARQHVVGVGRQRNPAQRQAHRPRQHGGHRIAEVAGGYHQVEHLAGGGMMGQRRVRVIAHLRQPAPKADAVGRAQRHLRLQRAVAEGLLDHRLAVIERPGHAQGLDVVAEAAQLVCLARRHPAVGIQHHYADPRLAVERSGNGGAGIAGGGHHDGQLSGALALQVGQAGRQEACAEILERCGGAVEQLQHVVAGRTQRAQRRGEVEGLFAQARQLRLQCIASEIQREHRGGIGGQRSLRRPRTRLRALRRHVQAAIGGQARSDGLAQGGRRRSMAGGNEVHRRSCE
ncbi:hypothetical protein D3C71_889740 [compost metagenome]